MLTDINHQVLPNLFSSGRYVQILPFANLHILNNFINAICSSDIHVV